MVGSIWHNDSIMVSKRILERQFFAKGKNIFVEGDDAFSAFIVQSGLISVYSVKDNKKIEFSKLGAGDIFGEMALIQDGQRNASVQAIEDTTVIVVTRDDFNLRLEKSDSMIRAVVDMLSQRLMSSNSEIIKSKGVNIDSFIALLNQLFIDLLEAMPNDEKDSFKADAFPVLKQLVKVIEKYRDKL
jgi:CRP-like cAMP-binding protein